MSDITLKLPNGIHMLTFSVKSNIDKANYSAKAFDQ